MVGAVSIPPALDLVRSPACFAACQNRLCFYAMKWSLVLSWLLSNELLLCNGQKKKMLLLTLL